MTCGRLLRLGDAGRSCPRPTGLNEQNGVAARCGQYPEKRRAGPRPALDRLPQHFTQAAARHLFYNIYGIERTGRLFPGSVFIVNMTGTVKAANDSSSLQPRQPAAAYQ